jgi:hypothetical protein
MSCSSCGAATAEDQRYCLNCGQRQGEPRVDFRSHLDAGAPRAQEAGPTETRVASAPVAAPPSERPTRDYAPLAAVGGIAVLGVMLLIGVLIGRGTGEGSVSAAPQVITVGTAGPSGADAAEKPSAAGAGRGAAEAGKGTAAKKGAKEQNTAAGGSVGTGDAPVASQGQLEALQEKTGEDYAEESAKLPDEIATPGTAPPTDEKAPGGGSGGVTIE